MHEKRSPRCARLAAKRKRAIVMQKVVSIAVLVAFSGSARAADPPRHVLTDGRLTLSVLLPDAKTGFYRGTRFDWSGVVEKAQINGHTLFGYWKATHDPTNHDD